MLKRQVKTLRTDGTISFPQFIKMFTFTGKADLILQLLNHEAAAHEPRSRSASPVPSLSGSVLLPTSHNTSFAKSQRRNKSCIHAVATEDIPMIAPGEEERLVCRGMLEHVKRLVKVLALEREEPSTRARKIAISEHKRGVLSQIQELYGANGCRCIAGLSQRLLAGPDEGAVAGDKGLRRLLAREFRVHRKNNAAYFGFPNAKLLEHYVLLVRIMVR